LEFFTRIKGVTCASAWGGVKHEQILEQKTALAYQFMGLLHAFFRLKNSVLPWKTVHILRLLLCREEEGIISIDRGFFAVNGEI